MNVKYPLHEHGMSEHEHTKTDGLGDAVLLVAGGDPSALAPAQRAHGRPQDRVQRLPGAVPDHASGKVGACDRYANQSGVLVRVDPVLLMRTGGKCRRGVPWCHSWRRATPLPPRCRQSNRATTSSSPAVGASHHLSRLQAGAVHRCVAGRRRRHGHRRHRRHLQLLQPEGEDRHRPLARPRAGQRALRAARWSGHVSTAEYGSQMLSLGGVHHLTGGSKKEGRVTCEMMKSLGNKQPVELAIDGGTHGCACRPARRRWSTASRSSACASAAARPPIGIFAQQFAGSRRRGGRRRRSHHRRAHRAPGRPLPRHAARRASRCAAASRRRGATSRSRTRAPAGAAPTSPIRWRSSRAGMPTSRGRACAC